MGKSHEGTFHLRGYTDGEQAHEKMFNIISNWGTANQNHEISLHTYWDG